MVRGDRLVLKCDRFLPRCRVPARPQAMQENFRRRQDRAGAR
jgi:hypothetical protein